jgi:hypothetical protein
VKKANGICKPLENPKVTNMQPTSGMLLLGIDCYKCGRNGQALYISPANDISVVWFSTRYNNSPWLSLYARALVKELAE